MLGPLKLTIHHLGRQKECRMYRLQVRLGVPDTASSSVYFTQDRQDESVKVTIHGNGTL